MSNYQTIPECGWPCRLNEENKQIIELNDGTCLVLRSEDTTTDKRVEVYFWYDIEGSNFDRFDEGSDDFENWNAVHKKLLSLSV